MADTTDLKSVEFIHVGSNPIAGTMSCCGSTVEQLSCNQLIESSNLSNSSNS